MTPSHTGSQCRRRQDLDLLRPTKEPLLQSGADGGGKFDVQEMVLAPLRCLTRMDPPLRDEARYRRRKAQTNGSGTARPRAEVALRQGAQVNIGATREDCASRNGRRGPVKEERAGLAPPMTMTVEIEGPGLDTQMIRIHQAIRLALGGQLLIRQSHRLAIPHGFGQRVNHVGSSPVVPRSMSPGYDDVGCDARARRHLVRKGGADLVQRCDRRVMEKGSREHPEQLATGGEGQHLGPRECQRQLSLGSIHYPPA